MSLPVGHRLLRTRRPWEPRPCPFTLEKAAAEYREVVSPRHAVLVFFVILAVHAVVAFLSLFVNAVGENLVVVHWRAIHRPAWASHSDHYLIALYAVSQILCSVSVWFVYMDGLYRNRWRLLPYFAVLLGEALWPDALFKARSLALATVAGGFVCAGLLLSGIFYRKVTPIATLFLVVPFGVAVTGTILAGMSIPLNPTTYDISYKWGAVPVGLLP